MVCPAQFFFALDSTSFPRIPPCSSSPFSTMRLALLEVSVAQNNPARGSLQRERRGSEKSRVKREGSAGAFRARNPTTSSYAGRYSK
jgi:hypothetical protein